MKKIVIHCTTGIACTDAWHFVEVADDAMEDELNDLAWGFAVDNAEMHGRYPPHEDMDDEEYNSEDTDDNIDGYWVAYEPKLHDMHTHSGTPHFQQC
jgi:hypothetical protein